LDPLGFINFKLFLISGKYVSVYCENFRLVLNVRQNTLGKKSSQFFLRMVVKLSVGSQYHWSQEGTNGSKVGWRAKDKENYLDGSFCKNLGWKSSG
jgi:hypothetical protein